MKDQNHSLHHSLSTKLKIIFLSYFHIGHIPWAPGTFGSLFTIPLILLFSFFKISFWPVAIFTLILTTISCFIAQDIQKSFKVIDPGWIVIDEVIGMLITWLFVFPSTEPLDLLLVFIVFRLFDIFKVHPAKYIDQKIHNGAGTILDDVVSAVYAGSFILLIKYFII